MVTIKVRYVGNSPVFHRHPGYQGKEGASRRERFKVYPGEVISMNLDVWNKELKKDTHWELESPEKIKTKGVKKNG